MKRKHFNFTGLIVFLFCTLLGVVSGGSLMASGTQTNLPDAGKMQVGNPQTANNTVQGVDRQDLHDASGNIIKRTVDSEITKIRPCFTPIDTLLRSIGSQPVNDFEFNYYSVGTIPFSTIASVYTLDQTATGSYKEATISVTDTTIFVPSSTVKLHTVYSDGTTEVWKDYILYVVSITNSGGTKTLKVAYGGADCPTAYVAAAGQTAATPGIIIARQASQGVTAIESTIYRLGRAAVDGEKQTVNVATMPTDTTNYCQIFKWQVSATTIEQMVDKEVKWTLSDMEEEAAVNFKMEMEGSFLFSRKTIYWDSVKGKKVYSMGGIVENISKTFTFNTSNGEKEIIDLCQHVFQGNVGNRKRMMFVGSNFNSAISKMMITATNRQMYSTETKTICGLDFEVLKSNFGQLWIYQHDLMDLYGWSDKAIILDIDNVKRKVWFTKTTKIPEAQNNEFDGDISIYTEAVGVAVKYPDTHCIVTLAS